MPSNHFLLCLRFFLLPSIFLSIRVFSSELVLCIKCPKFWSFSFSISPSNEYSGLISFRFEWFDLAVQGTLKSLLQHHNSLKGGKVFYGKGAQKRWNGRGRESWATDKRCPFFWLLQKRQYSLFYTVLNCIVISILMTLWVVTFILICLLNCEIPRARQASLVAQRLKNLPAVQETWVWCLGWEDPLEKGMATHSSILAWKIPWTEVPGGL